MPRSGFKSSPALAIELDGDMTTHIPGDALTGYITVATPSDQNPIYNFQVRLKLFGRVKTKYKVKRNNGTSIVRGRAVLFEQSYLINKSEICQNGEYAWPFSITIPKSSAPGFARRGDEFKPEPFQGYLHTRGEDHQEVDVSTHPLPSVLYYFSNSKMSGKTVEAYIEYVLVATSGESTAYHPVYVRQQSVQNPITNYRFRTYSTPNVVKSPKLLREHAHKELTIGQKTSRFFRPGKTPRYSYTVKVDYPQVIQLEHPEPIPLKIHIIPDLDPQKTTIDPDNDLSTLPPVYVVSVEIKLRGDLGIRCPGSLWDSDTVKTHTFPLSNPMEVTPVAIPVIHPAAKHADLVPVASAPEHPARPPPPVPDSASTMSGATLTTPFPMPETASLISNNTTDAAVSESSVPLSYTATAPPTTGFPASKSSSLPTPLNLGAHMSILLGCSAVSTHSRRPVSFKRQVYPTFATYNIVLKYRLEWKIKMVCAGERHSVSGEYPVVIMAPSEEQERQKTRELGTAGMKKNYDDLEHGFGVAMQVIGGILQAVT